jgi:hypothetical protein
MQVGDAVDADDTAAARRRMGAHARVAPRAELLAARIRIDLELAAQASTLNELWRTVVIRLPPVGVTLAFSGMGIAPHSDSHPEASRLRSIRDGAFVASDH